MKKLAIIVVAVIGFAMTAAVAHAAKPAGMSQPEYRALMLRSEALNHQYGLDVPVKGENYFARGLPTSSPVGKPAGMTAAEYRALMLRSEGLNRQYGLDVPVKGENYFARGLPDSSAPIFVSAPSSTGFQWGDAGIGAAGLLGVIAVVAGILGLRRHRFQLSTS